MFCVICGSIFLTKGCAGSKQGSWNRKSRRTRKWILGKTGLTPLSKRIIGLRPAVLHEDEIHRAQCLNYLKATAVYLCLLLNFGKPRLEIKRIVLAQQGIAALGVFCVICGSIFLPVGQTR